MRISDWSSDVCSSDLIDMSSSFPGLYFGVRRSPVKTAEQAVLLARRIAASSGSLRLRGAMGYEGQIAGLPDDVPKPSLKNRIVPWLTPRPIRELSLRRQTVVDGLYVSRFALAICTGGDTRTLEPHAPPPPVPTTPTP